MGIRPTLENAKALQDLAKSMPVAVKNIADSTDRLLRTYQSYETYMGPHSEVFKIMFLCVKKAQEEAAGAIENLPPKLNNTARKIIEYWNFTNQTK